MRVADWLVLIIDVALDRYIDEPLVEDYCTASRRTLTTRYTGDTIGVKSDENQEASLAAEMGNHN